jgi:ribosomal protein L11 methyltransferase
MSETWKISIPCTRDEGEALAGVTDVAGFAEPPVIMSSEPDEARPEEWRLDAYLEAEPNEAEIAALLALTPSAARGAVTVERLADADWVTLSQRELRPVTAGRFHVYTEAYVDTVTPDLIGIRIEAGQAFGTGQHQTTEGCLRVIDRMTAEPANIIDVGTGSGVLALAAVKRWRGARVTASDIDPIAVEVTAENVAQNGERKGDGPGELLLAVAAGLDEPVLRSRGPYDLVIANILAGPLIALADDLVGATAPGGRIVLAGLLAEQQAAVLAAYEALGCRLTDEERIGDWPTLVLRVA